MSERPQMLRIDRTVFRRRWWMANSVGFFVGHVAYGLLSHGITGPHGDDLTPAQYGGHLLGLLAAVSFILPLQRAALRPFVSGSTRRLSMSVIAYVFAFFLGVETIGPPADWILAFTVLGAASWIGAPLLVRPAWLWSLGAVLAFSFGMLLIIPVGDALIWAGILDLKSVTLLDHTIMWLVIATPTGVAGGFLSSWLLAKMLVERSNSQIGEN